MLKEEVWNNYGTKVLLETIMCLGLRKVLAVTEHLSIAQKGTTGKM